MEDTEQRIQARLIKLSEDSEGRADFIAPRTAVALTKIFENLENWLAHKPNVKLIIKLIPLIKLED